MSIDPDILYSPIYDVLGVDAVLSDAITADVALVVIDKTAGIEVLDRANVQTIRPACIVRMSALTDAGVTRADLDDATIVFNGQTWTVKATLPKPAITGEADGELYLILAE